MLKLGVQLAELSPRAPCPTAAARRVRRWAALHAKLAVIDRRWLLVGSMNMDLRSSRLNTEIALAIDDPALAGQAAGADAATGTTATTSRAWPPRCTGRSNGWPMTLTARPCLEPSRMSMRCGIGR